MNRPALARLNCEPFSKNDEVAFGRDGLAEVRIAWHSNAIGIATRVLSVKELHEYAKFLSDE